MASVKKQRRMALTKVFLYLPSTILFTTNDSNDKSYKFNNFATTLTITLGCKHIHNNALL